MGMGACPYGLTWEIEVVALQAKIYLSIPRYAGGEHLAQGLKTPLFYKDETRKMRARPVSVATVSLHEFSWLLVLSIIEQSVASCHTVDHL